jgi:hypothetical protein
MARTAVLVLFTGLNLVLLCLALNPWLQVWRDQAIRVLLFEGLFMLLVGVPVLGHQMIIRKKTFRQSVTDSIDAVLGMLAGFS